VIPLMSEAEREVHGSVDRGEMGRRGKEERENFVDL